MFNLLPSSTKETIKIEYKWRLLVVFFTVIFCIQFLFLIALFPSWLISLNKEQNAILEMNNANESQLSKDVGPIALTLTGTNQKLAILNGALAYQPVVPLFEAIVTHKTSAIHLTQFIYTSTGAKTATLTLGGSSDTREALASFVKSLQSSGVFTTADLPVSNLAKDTNISFFVNITIAKS